MGAALVAPRVQGKPRSECLQNGVTCICVEGTCVADILIHFIHSKICERKGKIKENEPMRGRSFLNPHSYTFPIMKQ